MEAAGFTPGDWREWRSLQLKHRPSRPDDLKKLNSFARRSVEPMIDRLECPAAKRGKLGDRLAAPPGVAIPDDGLQARCQKLEQRELFHECRLFTNNKG